MSSIQSSYISPSEFLLAESDRADGEKYEYVNGQVYAMAGASRDCAYEWPVCVALY